MAPTDKDEISLETAIAHTASMRNSFRSFEKLRQVLSLAQQAEQRARDGDQTAKKLEKGNASLLEKQHALEKAVDGLDAKYHEDVKQQTAAHNQRIQGFKKDADAVQATYLAKSKELASQLDAEREAKQGTIKRLEVEEKRLEDVTGRLRQELQQLKSRIPDMA